MDFDMYDFNYTMIQPPIESDFKVHEEMIKLCFSISILMWFMSFAFSWCSDPLAENLRMKLSKCEDELVSAESTISDYEDEIKDLTFKLKELSTRYDNCRVAAQKFMDTFPVSLDEHKVKRARIE